MTVTQEDLKELKEEVQKLTGKANMLIQLLNEFVFELNVVEKCYLNIDIGLYPTKVTSSLSKDTLETVVQEERTKLFRPAKQTLESLTMTLAKNLDLKLKEGKE